MGWSILRRMRLQDDKAMAETRRLLTQLHLLLKGVIHTVPLEKVRDVLAGSLVAHHGVPVPLDDLCSTLMLRNKECVTFRLGSLQERDAFTTCMKLLALTLK